LTISELRFAIIGCGRIAKNYGDPLTELEGARLAAVCDLIPERAEVWSIKMGARNYCQVPSTS
jgi:UDP-N-acetyl-2-amino-2-deoxyglucuronate dehydrogenase